MGRAAVRTKKYSQLVTQLWRRIFLRNPIMTVLQYPRAPQFEAEFLAALPSFGADREMTQWAANYAGFHAGRCYWDAHFLSERGVNRCLNIGGAPYLFEFALRKARPEVQLTTIDLEPGRFPNAGSIVGMRVIRGNIEVNEPLPLSEAFDVVVFAEIFEHLRINVLATMSRVRDLLTPQGHLYLTMPNGLSLNAWRKRLLRGRTGPPPVDEWSKLKQLGHMGHVREYSLSEITEVLGESNFAIEETHFRVAYSDWPMRNILLRFWPQFAEEIVILAR